MPMSLHIDDSSHSQAILTTKHNDQEKIHNYAKTNPKTNKQIDPI